MFPRRPPTVLIALLAVVLTPAALAPAAERDKPTADDRPGVRSMSVTFDDPPFERGLSVERGKGSNLKPAKIGPDGTTAWRVEKGNVPGRLYLRAIRFRVTDPALLAEPRPVDVAVEYLADDVDRVFLYAATADGWTRVASGNKSKGGKWRTLKVQIDAPRFGDKSKSNDEGYGLQFVGVNGPVAVRSVRVDAYETRGREVDWGRLLRPADPIPVGAEGQPVFLFRPVDGNAVEIDIGSLAQQDRPVDWRMRLSTWDGKAVGSAVSGRTTVAAGGMTPLRIPLNLAGLPLGPYQASLELRLESDGPPMVTQTVDLGVLDGDAFALDKAKDEEFMFGLDVANMHIYDADTPVAAAWYKAMGVDVLRGLPHKGHPTAENMQAAYEFMDKNDLRAGIHMYPPMPNKQGEMDADLLAERTALLADWTARRAGRGAGRSPFIEIGNEPDLTGFWPGSMQSYIDAMVPLAKAAKAAREKAGLTADDILIANGGLSFAGREGDRRSREFLQLLPPDLLDAIAYHAHGPGVGAERRRLDILRDVMKGTAAEGLPVFDTETGVAGGDNSGLAEQARTAVEKLVYAQAQGMPTMIYFRLFMEGNNRYGMTENLNQPRPSVLAYRQLVRGLRGTRFARALHADADVPGGMPGLQAYLFRRPVDGGADGWALVYFTEEAARFDMTLRLAKGKTTVAAATLRDLYGNESPATVTGNGVTVKVTGEPTYLLWSADTPPEGVGFEPPMLTASADESLPTGRTSTVDVVVRNPTDRPMSARLEASAAARVPIEVRTPSRSVEVPVGGTVTVPVEVVVGEADAPLAMPRWWRLFPDAAGDSAASAKAVPESLPESGGGTTAGTWAWSDDGASLNFAKLVDGGARENRRVVGYATLDSPAAAALPVAADADWRMAWYVNGERVYSTLADGNGHGGPGAHAFELPLRRGVNVIAFECLAGTGGWDVEWYGPRERARLESGGVPADRLSLALRVGGEVLARRDVDLPLLAPLPDGGADGLTEESSAADLLRAVAARQPLAVAGEESVTNRYAAEPDQSRWYAGPADLSATAWLLRRGDGLMLVAAVRDDAAAAGDGVSVCVARPDGTPLFRGPLQKRPASDADSPLPADAVYVGVIPADQLAHGPLRVSLRVTDQDGREAVKQTLDAGDLDRPERGRLVNR